MIIGTASTQIRYEQILTNVLYPTRGRVFFTTERSSQRSYFKSMIYFPSCFGFLQQNVGRNKHGCEAETPTEISPSIRLVAGPDLPNIGRIFTLARAGRCSRIGFRSPESRCRPRPFTFQRGVVCTGSSVKNVVSFQPETTYGVVVSLVTSSFKIATGYPRSTSSVYWRTCVEVIIAC
jgi:hypothetical protein